MSDRVDSAIIQNIVGHPRHPFLHYGRAISEEELVYILHSQACLESMPDFRDCSYSLALDKGIDLSDWIFDQPLPLTIKWGRLVPRSARI